MIYFILDEDRHLVKIGYTASDTPEGRLRAFQTGNPARLAVLATMPGEMADEQALHRRFAPERVAGEWFRPCAGIFNLVAEANPRAPWKPRPVRDIPSPLTFYLAGKIRSRDWRHAIVRNMLRADDSRGSENIDWPVQREAIFGTYSYSGPFFLPVRPYCNPFTPGRHGSNAYPHSLIQGDEKDAADRVVELCQAAIDAADVVFAWIDSPDCYGTIAELGMASARGKEIWVAGPHPYPDMWLPYRLATAGIFRDLDPLQSFFAVCHLRLASCGHYYDALSRVRADPGLSAFYRLPAL